MLEPRIKELEEKKLVGKHLRMSLVNNRTGELWGSFMSNVKEIDNAITSDKISLQVYPKIYFDSFDPTLEFEKWATIEVADFNNVSDQWDTFVLKGGLYAVFDHKGSAAEARTFKIISLPFQTELALSAIVAPASVYAASEKCAPFPAPASTITSKPSFFK